MESINQTMDIIIIAGFIGSGKTTLAKGLVEAACKMSKKAVIISNESGEEKISPGFLEKNECKLIEISSGCICCKLIESFQNALNDITRELPDLLIIEPAGSCQVRDIVAILERTYVDKFLKINVVTVVDANDCVDFLDNMGSFYSEQIKEAGCICLTHTQSCNEEELLDVQIRIKEINSTAKSVIYQKDEHDLQEIKSALQDYDKHKHIRMRYRR